MKTMFQCVFDDRCVEKTHSQLVCKVLCPRCAPFSSSDVSVFPVYLMQNLFVPLPFKVIFYAIKIQSNSVMRGYCLTRPSLFRSPTRILPWT